MHSTLTFEHACQVEQFRCVLNLPLPSEDEQGSDGSASQGSKGKESSSTKSSQASSALEHSGDEGEGSSANEGRDVFAFGPEDEKEPHNPLGTRRSNRESLEGSGTILKRPKTRDVPVSALCPRCGRCLNRSLALALSLSLSRSLSLSHSLPLALSRSRALAISLSLSRLSLAKPPETDLRVLLAARCLCGENRRSPTESGRTYSLRASARWSNTTAARVGSRL